MESQVKVLREDEFLFRISVSADSEYQGVLGLHRLSSSLPHTVKTVAVKESEPLSKIYCIATNHSDYMGIEERFGVKTEQM